MSEISLRIYRPDVNGGAPERVIAAQVTDVPGGYASWAGTMDIWPDCRCAHPVCVDRRTRNAPNT